MKIINVKDIEVKETEGGPLFTGGKVYSQLVLDEEYGAKKIQMVMVNFAPGSRNRFHITRVGKSCMSAKAKELSHQGLGIYSYTGYGHLCSSG